MFEIILISIGITPFIIAVSIKIDIINSHENNKNKNPELNH